ncbi:HNH endonuclease [Enterobacter sp. RHB15-C17]|nr:HNH endonuclease [Enterobacter sp. RHB15-C17]
MISTPEKWEWVSGYNGLYQISNLGRVCSVKRPGSKGGLLKPRKDSDGYLMVMLWSDGIPTNKKIHRLVAQAFIPNSEDKPQVNHLNGNKADNSVSNLEWATPSENVLHAYRIGLKDQRGVKNPAFKGWIIGTNISTGETVRIAGKADIKARGFTQACVSLCVLGKQKKHKGFTFKLEENHVASVL